MCHMFRVIIGHFVVCRFLFVICVPELCLSLFFGDVLVNCYSWLAVVCDVALMNLALRKFNLLQLKM